MPEHVARTFQHLLLVNNRLCELTPEQHRFHHLRSHCRIQQHLYNLTSGQYSSSLAARRLRLLTDSALRRTAGYQCLNYASFIHRACTLMQRLQTEDSSRRGRFGRGTRGGFILPRRYCRWQRSPSKEHHALPGYDCGLSSESLAVVESLDGLSHSSPSPELGSCCYAPNYARLTCQTQTRHGGSRLSRSGRRT